MELTLGLLAEKLMDLYYQQYRTDDDFFTEDDFQFYASLVYATVLQEDYNESYKMSGQETGVRAAAVNPEFFIPEIVEVKRNPISDEYEALLTHKPFSFRSDRSYSAVQGVYPVQGTCSDFVRSHVDRNSFRGRLPVTRKVFWYAEGRKLIFKNVQCALSKVKILYIPSLATDLAAEAPIAEAFGEAVLKRTLELMFAARQGKVIDKTQDQNPNAPLDSEINQVFKKGKT